MKDLPEQKTVSFVDLPRFMGPWHVIACIPTFVEKGAHNAIESYSWNAKKKRIDVNFTMNKDSFNGPKKSYPQKAWVHDKKTGAEWRVQFFWPLKFAYLIVDLAEDYSDTIVGVPDRDHVWIMSREPEMSEARYQEQVAKVRALGYDTSKLVKIPQEKAAKKAVKTAVKSATKRDLKIAKSALSSASLRKSKSPGEVSSRP